MRLVFKWLAVSLVFLMASTAVVAANALFTQTQAVPALDEVGLIGLIVVIGAAAGWIVKNRKK